MAKEKITPKKGDSFWIEQPAVRIITSDRRALSLKSPPRIRGKQPLIKVRNTPYAVGKGTVEGTDRWRLNGGPASVRAFVGGTAKPLTVPWLYSYLRSRFEQHIGLPDRGDYVLCAVFVVLSHVYRLFAAVPYLHLNGPKGSAKTTLGKMFEGLAFNAFMVTECSGASLFRTLDRTAGTFILDETEGMSTRDGSGEDPKTVIFRGGYQNGAAVTRQNKDNVEITESFDIYSPKVIINISGLDDITAQRAIRIRTQPASRAEAQNLTRFVPRPRDRYWAPLRDHLHCLAMIGHQRIAALRDEMAGEDLGLHNRDRELWFPVLVVGRYLEEAGTAGLEHRLRELAMRKTADREAVRSEGPEEALLDVLIGLLESRKVSRAAVTPDEILDELGGSEAFDTIPTRNALGKLLSAHGISQKRKRIADRHGVKRLTRVYELSLQALRARLS